MAAGLFSRSASDASARVGWRMPASAAEKLGGSEAGLGEGALQLVGRGVEVERVARGEARAPASPSRARGP